MTFKIIHHHDGTTPCHNGCPGFHNRDNKDHPHSYEPPSIMDLPKNKEAVNHPDHYNAHPSGVECITVVRHFNFNLGNVIKYIWRAGIKNADVTIEDLRKARWYLNDEITRRENGNNP